jgi:hypothetical protein
LAHFPLQEPLDYAPEQIADSGGYRIYSEMNMSDWWWDIQDQHPTGVTIVLVICASNKTHMTNVSANQHAYPLNFPIGTIQKEIRHTPKMRSWIHVGLIPCPRTGAKHIDEAWHSTVGTGLS